jgi:hypothetical protein
VVNRRRLLDAKFVSAEGNQWVTLNLESVALDWRRHRKNFGIEVMVRDDNDTEVDAKALFVSPNCSVGRGQFTLLSIMVVVIHEEKDT